MLCEEENFRIGPPCASNSSTRAAARRGNLRLRGGTLWQSIHVNNGTEKSDKKNSSIDRGFQKENVVIASEAKQSSRRAGPKARSIGPSWLRKGAANSASGLEAVAQGAEAGSIWAAVSARAADQRAIASGAAVRRHCERAQRIQPSGRARRLA
jgi:hypothetical protein